MLPGRIPAPRRAIVVAVLGIRSGKSSEDPCSSVDDRAKEPPSQNYLCTITAMGIVTATLCGTWAAHVIRLR